jgi:hypothetical protein
MSTFSPSDAAFEGFQVLRRHWRVVVGWAAFNLLAMVAMVTFTVIVLVALEVVGGAQGRSQVAGQVGGVVAVLGYGATEIVIVTGLYRLMLRPAEPGFLHLRLGRSELRTLAGFAAPALALTPLAFAGAIAVGAAAVRSLPAGIVLGAALLAALATLALRFALTPVIGFAEGGVPLPVAWRMSRGQSWRLIGMAVLVACLLAVMGVAIWLALFVAGGLLTGFDDLGLSGAESLAAHPGRYVFQIVAELVLAPIFLIIAQAPFVAVYRALKAPA